MTRRTCGVCSSPFSKIDYTVTEADSGAALKKLLPRKPPDVVLLDLKLPDANGLDLLPQIKKAWPDTEVIVLTGAATLRGRRRGHQARRVSFHQQAVRHAAPAGHDRTRDRKPPAEGGEQLPPPRRRHHERRLPRPCSRASSCRTSCAPSSASRPAT